MLTIEGLEKSFGSHQILKHMQLHVPKHAIFGFIGQNGAGKTTTMKLILGLLEKDAGQISICGTPVCFGKTDPRIGYLSDVPEYYGFMSAQEYMQLCADISHIPKTQAKQRIEKLLFLVGLHKQKKKRLHGFSRGMKQRLGIAQALLNEPELLICDEPTSALDPVGRREILDVLKQVKEQTTVILSTHILSDVERICDQIAILHEGSIVYHGTIEEVKGNYGTHNIEITFSDASTAAQYCDKIRSQYPDVRQDGNEVCLPVSERIQPNETLLKTLIDTKLVPVRYALAEPTLEDVFMEVIK